MVARHSQLAREFQGVTRTELHTESAAFATTMFDLTRVHERTSGGLTSAGEKGRNSHTSEQFAHASDSAVYYKPPREPERPCRPQYSRETESDARKHASMRENPQI